MIFSVFLDNEKAQEAASTYVASFGGRFIGEEPGDRLIYETKDGEAAYTPPDGATLETVLCDLQSGKPLTDLWPELVYDPDMDY